MNNNLLDNISISIEEIFSHIKMALIFVIFLGTMYVIIFTLMGEMERIEVLGWILTLSPIITAIFAFILGFIVMHLGILKLVLPIPTLIIILSGLQEFKEFERTLICSIPFFIPLFFDVFFRRWRIYKNYVIYPKLTIFLNILYYLVSGGFSALIIFIYIKHFIFN